MRQLPAGRRLDRSGSYIVKVAASQEVRLNQTSNAVGRILLSQAQHGMVVCSPTRVGVLMEK